MRNTSRIDAPMNTRMGSLTLITHRNTAPTRVDKTTESTICSASSTLAYSHKLLYRRNAPMITMFTTARIPRMKKISLLVNTSS